MKANLVTTALAICAFISIATAQETTAPACGSIATVKEDSIVQVAYAENPAPVKADSLVLPAGDIAKDLHTSYEKKPSLAVEKKIDYENAGNLFAFAIPFIAFALLFCPLF